MNVWYALIIAVFVVVLAGFGLWLFFGEGSKPKVQPSNPASGGVDRAISRLNAEVGRLQDEVAGLKHQIRRAEETIDAQRPPRYGSVRQPEQPQFERLSNLARGASPLAPVFAPPTNRITDALAALHNLINSPTFVARDRFIAEFNLSNLDANLATTATESLYWRLPAAADRIVVFPGWSIVKDWHTTYRGAEKDIARQSLSRYFDIEPGATLRVRAPAIVAAGDPAVVIDRGCLEGS